MRKHKWIIFALVLSLSLFLAGCSLLEENKPDSQMPVTENTDSSPASDPKPSPTQAAPFTASFEIYTNGTKRIFTNPRYHRQSPQVYLTAQEPATVHVAEPGSTWSDLFASLPMSLDGECLVTGTEQTFCTNQSGTLRFFLNEQEQPDVLDQEIQPNDHLRVTYGS